MRTPRQEAAHAIVRAKQAHRSPDVGPDVTVSSEIQPVKLQGVKSPSQKLAETLDELDEVLSETKPDKVKTIKAPKAKASKRKK